MPIAERAGGCLAAILLNICSGETTRRGNAIAVAAREEAGVLSLGIRAAAGECRISGTVQWLMQIHAGQSCVRGVRFRDVAFDKINLISPPHYGQVTLLGSGFSCRAKSGFQGEDSFVIGLTGAIKRVSGTSTIRIVVSLGTRSQRKVSRSRKITPLHRPRSQSSKRHPPLRSAIKLLHQQAPRSQPVRQLDWSSGSPPPCSDLSTGQSSIVNLSGLSVGCPQ